MVDSGLNEKFFQLLQLFFQLVILIFKLFDFLLHIVVLLISGLKDRTVSGLIFRTGKKSWQIERFVCKHENRLTKVWWIEV